MALAYRLMVVVALGLVVMACSRGAGRTPEPAAVASPTAPAAAPPAALPTATPTVPPTATPAPAPTPAPVPASDATLTPADERAAEVRAYLAQVFPQGPGRDEVFVNCTACHGIHVLILSGQSKDEQGWWLTRYMHERKLAPELGELEAEWEYLQEHFGAHLPPPPPVPEALQIGWQNYL